MIHSDTDIFFMNMALDEARKAAEHGEVPVAALVVRNNEVIGKGSNSKHLDPTAHAEIIAIREATERLGTWNLRGSTLYVTLEPCPMCAGAIIQSRLDSVYFGAYDPKAGCCGTLYSLTEDERFNHRAKAIGGVMKEECAWLLSDYFAKKRKQRT